MSAPELLTLDFAHAGPLRLASAIEAAEEARRTLESGTGPGAEMRGWLDLPSSMAGAVLDDVLRAADRVRRHGALVVVGIGGSYLGARAVIEALSRPFEDRFPVLFAGHCLDGDHHRGLLERLAGESWALNVVSKGGNTVEPWIALEILWRDLLSRLPIEEARERVVVTTGASGGALGEFARDRGLTALTVPEDVSGRYSVFTSAGLLPIAAAGHDVAALLEGAREEMRRLREAGDREESPATAYAAFRLAAYRAGRKVEVLSTGAPRLAGAAEWWKQLFGESEGKDGRGLFPASIQLTTDLHSLGQWLQDGDPTAIETAIDVASGSATEVPASLGEDAPGLAYLAGKRLHDLNRAALAASLEAHAQSGVPSLRIEIPEISERALGALLYFFEYSSAVSAYALGVNPFDQPGVEEYKRRMRENLS